MRYTTLRKIEYQKLRATDKKFPTANDIALYRVKRIERKIVKQELEKKPLKDTGNT